MWQTALLLVLATAVRSLRPRGDSLRGCWTQTPRDYNIDSTNGSIPEY